MLNVLFASGFYFLFLGIFSSLIPRIPFMDLFMLGSFVMMAVVVYLYLTKGFKGYYFGLMFFIIFIFMLVIINDMMLQIIILFLLMANVIYLIFYLGIYTTCIDQISEEGISSEEYIPDFNIKYKVNGKPENGQS